MGAGKTTVGRLVAGLLGWRFFDVDEVLVSRARMPIAELFGTHGEEAFRLREAETVRELLGLNNAVIALGGGALERAETRDLLLGGTETLVVFLEAPLSVSLARCAGEPGGVVRPVLRDPALEARYQRRLPFYRATAGLTLATHESQPEALAKRIAEAVRDSGVNIP